MGMLDSLLVPKGPAKPVEVPEFVPTDVSALSDREVMETILRKLEAFEHMGKVFSAQAQASPLLASFVPKV
jgi:hypothetical protein